MSMTACGVSPRNRGLNVKIFTGVLFGASFVAVLLRFIHKLILARIDLGFDDFFVFATWLSLTASFLITIFGLVKNGLGQETWSLYPDTITEFMKFVYIAGGLYFFDTLMLKFCFLAFYLRVFTATLVKRILWITIVSVAIWGIFFQCIMLFRCRPLSFNWEYWDNLHHGQCMAGAAFPIWHGALSVAIDIWMLAIPLWQVWGLQMHWKKKARVALMFVLGTLVTVVSALRLTSLIHVTTSTNPTWDLYDAFLWSKLEIGVGVICACLPGIRKFFLHFIPSPNSSVPRSHGYYFDHGRNDRRSKTDRGQSSLGGTGLRGSTTFGARSTFSKDDEDQANIMMETLCPDQHKQGGGDELSLVSHSQAEDRPQSHQSVV